MTDEPLEICPECGGSIRRVFYPAGIVFKGSGFYKTDHNASSTLNSNGHTPKSENGSTAATSETSTSAESKPTSKESSSNSTKSENKAAAPATS
jgi:predicted nucleic acid-binding Zn ribbon protein